MEKEILTFIRSVETFRESDSFQLYRKLRKSRLILYPLRHNYISLSQSFNNFHLRQADPRFWSDLDPNLRWNIQKRITTNVLNYLSSAYSIVDISREFARKELDNLELDQYNQFIKSVFEGDVEFRIIKKLRNYILHYSLLEIGVNLSWKRDSGTSTHILLTPEKLLHWKGWNAEEKQYLAFQGERLYIEPIIYRYHGKFLETQNILFLKIIRKYKDEILILIKKMDELLSKGIELNMTNPLPFKRNTLRYLKYLLKKI